MNQINQEQINIENESALDLVVSQNKAKVELANNLQGLGVNANASTDTLEQLAYKTSLVNADALRQKPKAIALNVNSVVNESDHERLYDGYVIKNGWFIWLYSDGSDLKLRRFKLSSMNISNYNTTKTISQGSTNVGTLDNGSNCQFVLNDDGSNVYIINNNTVKKYSIEGYDTNALTIPATGTSVVTYTPKFDYGEGYTNIDIYRIDINSTETQMLVIDRSGNVGIFDLTGSTTQNISILDSNKDVMFFANNTNNNLIEVKNNGGVYTINTFSIVSGQLNLISTYSYNGANSDYWKRAFLKYKDGNNYKFIMNLGNSNSNVDPTFIIIDCATMNLTPIFSRLNYISISDYNNDKYIVTPTITTIGNYHYLLAGLWVAIFDNNWNLVGNVINRFYTDSNMNFLWNTFIYDNNIYDLGQNGTPIYAMKHKTWLDKLIAYERTVNKVVDEGTVNERTIQVQIPYYTQLTETDLDNGVYNQ